MVKGVAKVWVPAEEDIEWAPDFYRETLGFSVIEQDGPWVEIDAKTGSTWGSTAGAAGGAGLRWSRHNLPAGERARGERGGLEGQRGRVRGEISEHEWGRVARLEDSEETTPNPTGRGAVEFP